MRYILINQAWMPWMRSRKPVTVTHKNLLASFAGAILFLVQGCDSETPATGERSQLAERGSAKTTATETGQATAVYAASFHKLEDWNTMQPLSKWKGKHLVLNFWATWCKSCQHEVPELNKLYNQFKDSGAVVVGLAIDNADKVKDYTEKYGVDYPILVGGDEAMELSKKMGNAVGGLPYTIMITPQGEVVETILGSTEKGTLPRVLTPYLEG
jgi:thiol-disulfide isomerase/thioredoxin